MFKTHGLHAFWLPSAVQKTGRYVHGEMILEEYWMRLCFDRHCRYFPGSRCFVGARRRLENGRGGKCARRQVSRCRTGVFRLWISAVYGERVPGEFVSCSHGRTCAGESRGACPTGGRGPFHPGEQADKCECVFAFDGQGRGGQPGFRHGGGAIGVRSGADSE